MTNNLSDKQKENMQTAYLHRAEEALQKKIVTKKMCAKTSKDIFEAFTLEYARPVCNNCHSIIRLYEMTSFNKNGGLCGKCQNESN